MRFASIVMLLLAAVPIAAANDAFDVTLIEPSNASGLAAGSSAVISWRAANLPAHVEEWEAFLSIDGGRTYPLRLTPHLDASIHRFAWRVPEAPAAHVTIMLRFGDERDERRFVFPLQARISGIALPLASLLRRRTLEVSTAGEPAEEGGEGVVAWVEGTRDGGDLREVSAGRRTRMDRTSVDAIHAEKPAVALPRSPLPADSLRVLSSCAVIKPEARRPAALSPPDGSDKLRTSMRLNV